MRNIQVAQTMEGYQMIDRLRQRGFTHIGILGSPYKMSLVKFLGRHPENIFLPTVHADHIIMISVSSFPYVLEAVKNSEGEGHKDWTEEKPDNE